MSEREDHVDGGDGGPVFEAGDQDYGSARGWNGLRPFEEVAAEARKRDPQRFEPDPEMLYARPASEWIEIAKRGQPAECLFGQFWQVEELAVLFGGPGTGKSALAIQIAEALARGVPLAPFNGPEFPKLEPQKVVYLDFELNMTQFAMRYARIDAETAEFGHHYAFSPNLIRTEMYWNGRVREGYGRFAEMFLDTLSRLVDEVGATAVVVDNITFLERASTSNPDTALSIMRSLRQLKQQSFVSILALAHTPKRRPWMPLTDLDLQGSNNIANFADSIFALGRCRRSEDLRYLKQIKVRTGRPEYTERNVPVFTLEKYDNAGPMGHPDDGGVDNFLGMRFVEFAREDDVLEPYSYGTSDAAGRRRNGPDVVARARRLAARGKSTAAVAAELGIPKTTAYRYICRA